VVAKVLDGGLLLELGAVGAAALIILLAVDVHCGEGWWACVEVDVSVLW
jgi:hypothetical protein